MNEIQYIDTFKDIQVDRQLAKTVFWSTVKKVNLNMFIYNIYVCRYNAYRNIDGQTAGYKMVKW